MKLRRNVMPKQKCLECGKFMAAELAPGYTHSPSNAGHPSFSPDYSCAACGSAIFDTAEREKARADQIQRCREDYERDTGFLPGR
jgi:DNA-directed RNA polymerase subunit RPC12/RpoP